MTAQEWEKRMERCKTQSEMQYLLNIRPKDTSSIHTGVPVLLPTRATADPKLSKLNRLQTGKKK